MEEQYECENCGRFEVSWVLPLTKRNILLMFIHLMSFILSLVLFLTAPISWLIFIFWLTFSFFFRKLYKAGKRCFACGHLNT
ncbi:hypothetical protein Swoo_2655 [Shewanella woodyi ATCC 51908]|uniref:Uncharacterized protein n=1 Tax=Shewanella woodyi (strain ATCC 51908 / MS32) TaxID=392500 RepID=B1KHP6_SHEWM|nr:hypothetical protein Swoo_2655 [Shewanella woodyi ATCC 51908]